MRQRLVVLLAIMVVPFTAFSVYKAYDIERTLDEERSQSSMALARSVANSIDDYIESSEELLDSIAHSPIAREKDVEVLSAWFAEMLEHCDHYANIVFFDTSGDLIASGRHAQDAKKINVAEASWFKRSMVSTELAVGEFSRSKIGGEPDVHLSLPVIDESGARVGVVSVAMHLTRVQARLMREQLPSHTTVAVVDRDGIVIARNRDAAEWVGKSVYDAFDVPDMLARGEGEGAASVDGERLLCTFTDVQQAPWFVRVGVRAEHVDELAARELGNHFAVFVPLLLVAIAGWLWIGGEVSRLHRQTELLSLVDPLTGLGNSRSLREDMRRSLEHAVRSGEPLAFAMMDLDDFKTYNDRFGHVAGDEALCAAAEAIRSAIRVADRAYRYGGEEFCLLLPDADAEGAAAVAERARRAIADVELRPSDDDRVASLSVSIGVAVYPGDAADADELLSCADTALYVAKRGGKDRVQVHCAPD